MPRSSIAISFSIAVLIALTFSTNDTHAQCEIGWSNPVHFDWPVHSARPGVDFDEDGAGPKPSLFMFSGWLYDAGNVQTDGLAGWDGTYWQAFPGGSDIMLKIQAMATTDVDGPGPQLPALYVGGSFASVGGVVAGRFARYSNGAWHGVADGVPAFPFGNITKLITLDIDGDGPVPPRLFALGSTLAELAEDTWQLVGESTATDFKELDIIAADLDGSGPLPLSLLRSGYAGTSSLLSEVDRWTGSEWQRLGEIFQGQPLAMAMFDADQSGPREAELYVGGSFTQIAGQSIRALARWREGHWQAIEQPITQGSSVQKLAVGDDDGSGPRRRSLFVTGGFTVPDATSVAAINLGRWDGQAWEGLGFSQVASTTSFFVANLRINGELVARCFGRESGNYLVRDNKNWRHFHSTTFPVQPVHRVLDLDGSGPGGKVVVAADQFLEYINGGISKSIASWDGLRWTRIGSNELTGTQFKAIELFDFDGDDPNPPRLVVAGSLMFGTQRYVAAALVDDVWTPLGSPNTGTGNSLVEFDEDASGPAYPVLFLGGTFPLAGSGGSNPYLLRWNGELGWSPVEGHLDRAVTSLLVQDDDGQGPIRPVMYVAGPLHIDSLSVNGIGRWDGSQWSALIDAVTGENAPPGSATSMCSLEEETGRLTLCVGGSFNTTSGLKFAARWRNGRWFPMGTSLTSAITAMTFDDTGIDLNAPGRLYANGPDGLQRWTGEEWEFLVPGSAFINKISAIDFDGCGPMAPQLVVSGRFSGVFESVSPTLIGLNAAGIATWGPRQPFFFATPWDRSVAAGDRLSLKVATGGPDPMTFAWTRDGVTLVDGGTVNGAMTRELVINPVAFGDSGQYECIATNACGSIPSGPTLVRVCAALANGDINADGHIDGLDISPFVAMWTAAPSPQSDCAVDLTHNGVRDPDDLAWFVGHLLSP